MAKHLVKCAECGASFDLNAERGVRWKRANRYAHQICYPQGEPVLMDSEIKAKRIAEVEANAQTKIVEAPAGPPPVSKIEKKKPDSEDDVYYRKLIDYINLLFDKKVNWGIVGKQLKTYREEYGYSYNGMLKCLKYAYEIKLNSIDKAFGVGIIPICYKDAYNYYYSIWEAQQRYINKPINKPKDVVITITSPDNQKKKRKNSNFSFLDEED